MSLFLESLPLAAGMILLVSFVSITLQHTDENQKPWAGAIMDRAPPPVDLAIACVLVLYAFAVLGAALAFLASGVGWIKMGHRMIGVFIMMVRALVSLWVLAELFPPEGLPSLALPFFAASVGIAMASVLALALATRSRITPH